MQRDYAPKKHLSRRMNRHYLPKMHLPRSRFRKNSPKIVQWKPSIARAGESAALNEKDEAVIDRSAAEIMTGIGGTSDYPLPSEFESFRKLATSEAEVRTSFLNQSLAVTQVRGDRRFPYMLHAIVRLDPKMRDVVAEIITQVRLPTAVAVQENIAYARLGSLLEIEDPRLQAVVEKNYAAAIQSNQDPFLLSELWLEMVELKIARANTGQRIVAIFVEEISNTTEEDRLSQLEERLTRVAQSLSDQAARTAADEMFPTMMERLESVFYETRFRQQGNGCEDGSPSKGPRTDGVLLQARSLASVLAAMPDTLSNSQSQDFTDAVLSSLNRGWDREEFSLLMQVLVTLTPKLTANDAAQVLEVIRAGIRGKDVGMNQVYIDALVAVSGQLTGEQLLEDWEAALQAEIVKMQSFESSSFTTRFTRLAAKMPNEQCPQAADKILDAMEHNPRGFAELTDALVALPASLTDPQARRAVDVILFTIINTKGYQQLHDLAAGLVAVGNKLTNSQAEQALPEYLKAIQTANDLSSGLLTEGLGAIAGKLTGEQATQALKGLIRIKRIVAQKVEVYWRKLCCTNRLRRAPSVVALASTLSPCL